MPSKGGNQYVGRTLRAFGPFSPYGAVFTNQPLRIPRSKLNIRRAVCQGRYLCREQVLTVSMFIVISSRRCQMDVYWQALSEA